MSDLKTIEKAYEAARQRYAELGVNSDKAMERLSKIAISLHCWQGDDVGGFESADGLSLGLQGYAKNRAGIKATLFVKAIKESGVL